MPTLKVSEEQLRLIQQAIDFYTSVGIGQFEETKDILSYIDRDWEE